MTAAGLVLGGGLCVAGAVARPRQFARGTVLAVGLLLAAAAWFSIASLWAVEPMVSFFGLVGQHNGAALWVLAAVWVAAGALNADARSLRESLLTVALAGAFFTSGAVYEAAQFGMQRRQGFAAGFFENSNSAGEMLAVAVLAAAACFLASRDARAKVVVALAGAASAAGLYLSDSRTGLLGLGAAVGFAALVALLPDRKPSDGVLAAVPPALAAAITSAALAASSGVLGDAARQAVAVIGTERDTIWRAALTRFGTSPIVGSGLEQLSAITHWSFAGGGLISDATADPHNILMAAALGGGPLGVGLVLAALGVLLWQGARVARGAGRSWAVALVGAMPAMLLGFGLVSWLAPAAVLCVAAITGAALGAARPKGQEAAFPRERTVRAIGAAAGVAAVVLGLTGALLLPVEYVYVLSGIESKPLGTEASLDLYGRSRDPGTVEAALVAVAPAAQSGDAAALADGRRLLEACVNGARSSATLALEGAIVAQALEAKDASGFPLFERFVRAGAQADPASGVWDAFGAIEADRLGLTPAAKAYAARALEFPMDAATRAEMERIRTR